MNLLTLIKNLFRAAKLLSVDDSGALRLGQVYSLGKNQTAMIFSPYGLMHNPPENSLVIIWNQQAQDSNSIGIADDPNNRTLKDLSSGEVALGNYLTGHYIYFDESGKCKLYTDNLDVIVNQDCLVTTDSLQIQVAEDITITAKNLTATCSEDCEINAVNIDLNASGAVGITATGNLNLAAAGITMAASTVTHGGVNVGGNHYHTQGNDSDGSVEQDTSGPQ